MQSNSLQTATIATRALLFTHEFSGIPIPPTSFLPIPASLPLTLELTLVIDLVNVAPLPIILLLQSPSFPFPSFLVCPDPDPFLLLSAERLFLPSA
jgi:hypothetical protein